MHLRFDEFHPGLHPEQTYGGFTDADGRRRHAPCWKRSLKHGTVDVGNPVHRRVDGAWLVELSHELDDGARRVYVRLSNLAHDPREALSGSQCLLKATRVMAADTLAVASISCALASGSETAVREYVLGPESYRDGMILANGPRKRIGNEYLVTLDDLREPRDVWVDVSLIVPAGPSHAELSSDPNAIEDAMGRLYSIGPAGAEVPCWPCTPRVLSQSDVDGLLASAKEAMRPAA